jgi:3-dehydroquinate synthase
MADSIRVDTEPPYEVRIGRGILGEVAPVVASHTSAVLITDSRVAELHREALQGMDEIATCALEPGEQTKSLACLERVLSFMAREGLDRASCVITLGGGVVGDLGGLAAALYMRGITFYACPTSLLAQVDASIGGKTAVNLPEGKNLAGAFHQPRGVWADTDVLATLEEEEWCSGLGEMLKTALVGGERTLAALEEGAQALRARDGESLETLIASCITIKARVVAADPDELDGRRVLNLGHSFGHAIERVAGFGKIPHGIAVAAGLALALDCSRRSGVLDDPGLFERTARLAERLGLPQSLRALREQTGLALDAGQLAESMQLDKKGRQGAVRLVLVRAPGKLIPGVEADPGLLAEVLA